MDDYQQILNQIRCDDRYSRNLNWGRPRKGHPEGTIAAHIEELECNLTKLRPRLSESEYWQLAVLVHVHDTFKPDAKQGVPILDPRSHASLARTFLAEHCHDDELLVMVQHHDEPYALWKQHKHRGSHDEARLKLLLNAISNWDVFLAFLIIDGCTVGKSRAPLHWFFELIAPTVDSRITAANILGVSSD